ncbi:MAG: citrate/2-methylcitrate synthase [Acidimicrobiales bacterium]
MTTITTNPSTFGAHPNPPARSATSEIPAADRPAPVTVPPETPAAHPPSTITVPAGLKGVVVADTAVGDVRGDEGFFHYGPYSAVDLARTRSLDEVWFLLTAGHLPDGEELAGFRAEVAPHRTPSPAVLAALPALAAATGATAGPLDALRTAVSLEAAARGLRPVLDLTDAERCRDALALAAVTPTLVAGLHRATLGLAPVAPRDDLHGAASYLWLLTGEDPDPRAAAALEPYLVTTIDHGFNASTFTARVIASTGADVGAAVVGAIGALSGPLHGGAPSRALDLLDEIGTVDRIEEVVGAHLAAGERIMGFGHAVYRTADPRSELLREVALGLGGPLVELAVAAEDRIVAVLAEQRPGRALRANVEYYAGVVMATVGIPRELFTPTFASSRVIGWTAHVLEQARDRHILRPSARYVGPPPPLPVPPRP